MAAILVFQNGRHLCIKKSHVSQTIQINIPDSIEMSDYDFSMMVAAKLYEDKKLSSRQAAKMVGLSKSAFIELLGNYEVSVFSNSVEDLHSDIANA